jgi:hypothetical protein
MRIRQVKELLLVVKSNNMAFKLNKITDSDLRKLAKLIPVTYSDISLYREVLGAHLLLAGITEVEQKTLLPKVDWIDGKPEFVATMVPVVENKKYSYPLKFKQPINHYKKLKKAFLEKGEQGVSDYAYGVRDFIEETAMPKSFGGIMTVNR